jgi:hypothetical protein
MSMPELSSVVVGGWVVGGWVVVVVGGWVVVVVGGWVVVVVGAAGGLVVWVGRAVFVVCGGRSVTGAVFVRDEGFVCLPVVPGDPVVFSFAVADSGVRPTDSSVARAGRRVVLSSRTGPVPGSSSPLSTPTTSAVCAPAIATVRTRTIDNHR